MEGRQLGMMLAPKSKKSKAKARKVEPEEGQGVNDAEVKDQYRRCKAFQKDCQWRLQK